MSKKLIAIVAVSLVVVLGGVAYFTYFAPRLEMASFTSKLAPIVKKEIKLNNDLEKDFEKYANEIEKLNAENADGLDKLIKIYDEVIAKLDSSAKEYEGMSKELKELDTPTSANNLKKSFTEIVDLNAGWIPDLRDYLAYEREFVNVLNSYDNDLSDESLPDDVTPEQIADYFDKANEKFKTVLKKLEESKVPSELSEHHKTVVSLFNDTSTIFSELAAALRKSDLQKYEAAVKKLEDIDAKLDSANIDTTTEKLTKVATELSKKETELTTNFKAEFAALERKYGGSWVSKDLDFEIK